MAEKTMDESKKDRSIWIKRDRSVGRKAQWGRLTGEVEEDAVGKVYWAERVNGGTVPLRREDFVLKQKPVHLKFVSVPASGKVSKRGKVQDRGRT